MHNYVGDKGTIFNYNSDFSGDISIKPKGKDMVNVPAEDILKLVAYCYVANKKISKVEDMDYKELLI